MGKSLFERVYEKLTGKIVVAKRYVAESNGNSHTCDRCSKNDGQIYRWPEDEAIMPKLPVHPNCKCHYEDICQDDIAKTDFSNLFNAVKYSVDEVVGPSAMPLLDATKIAADIATNFNHWVWISKSMARTISQNDPTFDLTEAYMEINLLNSKMDAKGLAALIAKLYKRGWKIKKSIDLKKK